MNWKTKALIQKSFAYLPSGISEYIYFKLQYRFGKVSPTSLYDTKKAFFFLEQTKKTLGDTHQIYLEIGSGWTLYLPMALWLGGAKQVITVDLHRYLKPLLVKEYIEFWQENRDYLQNEFTRYTNAEDFNKKFDQLYESRDNLNAICNLAKITYLAPADASELALKDTSVDVHISTNVLEHIPKASIIRILIEAKRVLKKNGLLIHRINPGDHFAHTDSSISSINFLQFNQNDWDKWAGNQFAYHNRLRATDLIQLFENAGFNPEIVEQVIDDKAIQSLKNSFDLDPSYSDYEFEDLATLGLILKSIK